MRTRNISITALAMVMLIAFASCEKLLERKPDELLPSEAIKTEQDLQEVLNSTYDILANTYNGTVQNLGELLSDNLVRPVQNDDYTEVWQRNTNFFNGSVGFGFAQLYRQILRANTIFEAAELIELTPETRARFEAEARFLRAIAHFDAVRLFAQPYGYTPNNTHPGVSIRTVTRPDLGLRSNVADVYAQIIADLTFAEANLPVTNGIYASQYTAKALLARVYFQMQEYELAAFYANDVIENSPFTLGITETFYSWPELSPEALLMVYSAPRGDDISDNRSGGLRGNYSSQGNTTLRMTQQFFQGATGSGGPRSTHFLTLIQDDTPSYVTNIFDAVNFHIPLLTLTEMHLTRAEAYSYLGINLSTAISDVNTIRTRALASELFNLPPGASATDIRNAARTERRYELAFTGDRVQQLKRRGVEGEPITVRGAPWDCPGMVLQFPSTEQVDGFPLNQTGGCN